MSLDLRATLLAAAALAAVLAGPARALTPAVPPSAGLSATFVDDGSCVFGGGKCILNFVHIGGGYATLVGWQAGANLANTASGSTCVGLGTCGFGGEGNSGAGLGMSGARNTALGDGALNAVDVGARNTAAGWSAGAAMTTGAHNTLLGYTAGGNIDVGSGNTLVGYLAGNFPLSSGNNNIIVGSGLAEADPAAAGSNDQVNVGNTYLNSQDAPAIASGFGTAPSVVAHAGAHVFTVNVGTGGVATSGVVTMPASPKGTGWACLVNDVTTNSATVFISKVTATDATSVTVGDRDVTGAAAAWADSDVLQFLCDAY